MTSGVYPRKPGHKAGKKPMFTKDEAHLIRLQKSIGRSTKLLSSMWKACEKTIRQVLNGTGAYKEMK